MNNYKNNANSQIQDNSVYYFVDLTLCWDFNEPEK